MKLLIIDDEPHIRHMMRLTLEAAGYAIDEAADGQAGLDRFGDGSGYDAVVLDQRMPGLDGLETLRRIKDRAPHSCVLMVTAFASIELAVDAMRLGATDFLRKPMTPETLRGAVAAALAGKTTLISDPPDRCRAPVAAGACLSGQTCRRCHGIHGHRLDRSRSGGSRGQTDAPAARPGERVLAAAGRAAAVGICLE
jgi:DNA-binding response OmpR family regulator